MELFIDTFVKTLSFMTMLSLGLNTTITSLKTSLTWRTLSAPLFLSFVLLPCAAYSLLWLLREENSLLILGLTVAVASAGGSSAGVFVKAVRGNESISGALVVIQSLISSLYLPLVLGTMFTNSSVSETTFPLLKATFLFQILPFLVGLALRKFSSISDIFAPWLSKINTIGLCLLIAGFAFQSFDQFKQVSPTVWITVFSINFMAFFGANLFSSIPQSLLPTISSSIGIRNLTMALLIMTAFEATSDVIAPILIYGLIMYIFAGLRLAFDLKTTSEPIKT